MASDANAAWTRSNRLPTLLGEDTYENETASGTSLQTRIEAYQAVLGGATLGSIFGNSITWPFGVDYSPSTGGACGWTSGTQWKTWFNTTGAIGRIWLGKLMRSREFWKMVPNTGHAVVTSGYGLGDTITVTARSCDGQTIISYVPNGNAARITVNMAQITSSASTVNEWWFNPSTGATTHIGTATASGSANFTPPDSNDWVLVLDDNSAGLPAPGSVSL